MRSKQLLFIIAVSICLATCTLFKSEGAENAVAKAGDSYLYMDEIRTVAPTGLSETDSTVWVNNYINNWARQQLFLQKAEVNLSDERQDELKELISQYQNDLFIKVYKEALTTNAIDTVVNQEEIAKYFDQNKMNFKLNEDLLKLRYIALGKQNYNVKEAGRRLRIFSETDIEYLDSIALQFKAFSLNDSIWVKTAHVYDRIPILAQDDHSKYLKKSQFFTLEDSIDIYLVHVTDILPRGELAPLAYVSPTVKQIILNKRKVEYLRQLDKDILNDAIRKKQFEVYE